MYVHVFETLELLSDIVTVIVLSYLTDFGYQGPSSECHSLCCGSVLTNVYSTSKYRENAVNASIKMDKNSIIVKAQ